MQQCSLNDLTTINDPLGVAIVGEAVGYDMGQLGGIEERASQVSIEYFNPCCWVRPGDTQKPIFLTTAYLIHCIREKSLLIPNEAFCYDQTRAFIAQVKMRLNHCNNHNLYMTKMNKEGDCT